MSAPPLEVLFEPLASTHDLASFRCAKPALADYLVKYARQNERADYGRTLVAVAPLTRQVLGYVSLCTASVAPSDLTEGERRGLPRYPMPAVLLTRMAVHEDVAGRGLGQRLVGIALRRALAAGELLAWRLFIVDALDAEVVPFYLRFGFRAMTSNPLRLYLNRTTVDKLVLDTRQRKDDG